MATPGRKRMLVQERHRNILATLETKDRVMVEELAERYQISAVTVRADLDTLADAGALVRTHGGRCSKHRPWAGDGRRPSTKPRRTSSR